MFIPSKASISDIAISEINNFVDVLIKLGKEAFTLSNKLQNVYNFKKSSKKKAQAYNIAIKK